MIGSNRRRNLQSIFLGLEGRDFIEIFDFIFDLMKDSELDALGKEIFPDKIFYIFNLQDEKNQLRLIDSYSHRL